MKKILALLLCLIICTVLLSCNGEDITTASTTEPMGPDERDILVSELSGYEIIRPASVDSTVNGKGTELKNAIEEKLDVKLKYRSDTVRENVPAYQIKELEILIGDTNRKESEEFLSALRYNDYGYGVVNKKIVIAGHTVENTVKAIDKFINEVLASAASDGIFLEYKSVAVRGEYTLDDLKIGELSAKNMAVVYPTRGNKNEEAYARELAELISVKSGYMVKAYEEFEYTHKDGEAIILVGDTKNTYGIENFGTLGVNEMRVSKGENALLITAGGLYSFDQIMNSFIDAVDKANGDTVSIKSGVTSLSTEKMSIMSFNVLGWERTEERNERVLTMIKTHMPDTIGMQEDLPVWIELFEKELPFYSYVGIPADGTGGESCAIFYLTEKFDVLSYGTKWLSDTPNEVSKHPESSANKIVTYATFKCKDTGKIFTQFNTHLEYENDEAREYQASKIVEFASQFSGNVILTGDYNAAFDTDTYAIVKNAGYFNSSDEADEAHKGGTFHLYSGNDGPAVDYVFVKGAIDVLYYKVCNNKINGEYASDHHPVYAEYKLK